MNPSTVMSQLSVPRLPAEWEPQSGVMLTWPDPRSEWRVRLERVETLYRALVRTLVNYVTVLVSAPPDRVDALRHDFSDLPVNKLRIVAVPNNDCWARDHGPITVADEQGLCLLDFSFNGWGSKYAYALDNCITGELHKAGAFGQTRRVAQPLILEGGSIESDGCGTLMTTSNCLLNKNRNPHLSRAEITVQLQQLFGVRKINWLDHGNLAGDDTDGHIDTLARLCPNNTIVYVDCDDPADEHYAELQAMAAQLRTFTNADGEPYKLVPLPWPKAVYLESELGAERLPATYANFLITNGAVLMPTYNDDKDEQARQILAGVFPDRDVIGLNCLALIEQHGSLHCITMQLPAGVLPL